MKTFILALFALKVIVRIFGAGVLAMAGSEGGYTESKHLSESQCAWSALGGLIGAGIYAWLFWWLFNHLPE